MPGGPAGRHGTLTLLDDVVVEFGITSSAPAERDPSGSGADVRRVTTSSWGDAYLKTTRADSGDDALAAATRELRCCRDLAPYAAFRTPELLAHHAGANGIALLLAAAGRVVPPRSWSRDMWVALGGQLALVHRTEPASATEWRRPDPLLDSVYATDPADVAGYWGEQVPDLARVLDRIEELLTPLTAAPQVFSHGDCHTGNVLFQGSQVALCDWQMAGMGRRAADLAFLRVRATPSGAAVPDEFLSAYVDRTGCDRGTLSRALVAEEIATWLFLWPPFARFNTPAAIERVRRRVRFLTSRW